ncbi:hypothetical protein [Pseudonocardia sp. NPDC049635]|uniref:hypothetical protein n=1 Tax=Pseudonocardia sp. NPDC049635 TaxID=3155506 RepID=UPI0033D348B9
MRQHVAFAGPRGGMSPDQGRAVAAIVSRWVDDGVTELHHQDDLTAYDLVDRAAALFLDLFVVAHPAVGQKRPTARGGINDEVALPLPADARDEHLLAVCGRVVVAVGGPVFWERSPVWRFAARARALGRELQLVDLDGAPLFDVQWPVAR